MTFGQSMPGVGCTHYGGQGAPAQACNGNLNIASIRVGTGENCVFYRNGGCSGDQIWYNRVNNCASFGSRTTIGSYKCVRPFFFVTPSCEKNTRLTGGFAEQRLERTWMALTVYVVEHHFLWALSGGALCARAFYEVLSADMPPSCLAWRG